MDDTGRDDDQSIETEIAPEAEGDEDRPEVSSDIQESDEETTDDNTVWLEEQENEEQESEERETEEQETEERAIEKQETEDDGLLPLSTGIKVAKVATGNNHTAALLSDGSLWLWGSNSAGQIGDGTTTTRSTPVKVMAGVKDVALGGTHSLALKNDGTLCPGVTMRAVK